MTKPIFIYIGGPGNNQQAYADMLADEFDVVVYTGLPDRHVRTATTSESLAPPLLHNAVIGPTLARMIVGPKLLIPRLIRCLPAPIDIMMVDSPFTAWWALYYRRRGLLRKVIYYACDWMPTDDPDLAFTRRLFRRLIYNRLDIYCARRADMTLNNSQRIVDARAAVAPDLKNAPNIVRHIMPFQKIERGLQEDFRILYVGSPRREHLIELLMDAISVLRSTDGIQVHLDLVGTSAYYPQLRSYALKLNLMDLVAFHGSVHDDHEFLKILRSCSLGYAMYLNKSGRDYAYYGFPTKIIHYFAVGIPAIFSDYPEFAAEIKGKNLGYVVKPDQGEIRAAVLDAIRNKDSFRQRIDSFIAEQNQEASKKMKARLRSLL